MKRVCEECGIALKKYSKKYCKSCSKIVTNRRQLEWSKANRNYYKDYYAKNRKKIMAMISKYNSSAKGKSTRKKYLKDVFSVKHPEYYALYRRQRAARCKKNNICMSCYKIPLPANSHYVTCAKCREKQRQARFLNSLQQKLKKSRCILYNIPICNCNKNDDVKK